MSWLNKQVRHYFQISRRESNGVIVLVPLIVIAMFAPTVYKSLTRSITSSIVLNRVVFDSLTVEIKKDSVKRIVDTKLKYEQWNKVRRPRKKEKGNYYIFKKLDPFDLNKADTAQLKKIRGIGSILSNRIVKYRDLLGGFVDKQQLKDVYNLSDSTLVMLDSLTFIQYPLTIRRISINSSSAKELMRHPYITPKNAWAIVNYRQQHESFSDLNEIRNIHALDEATLAKIIPYLSLQSAE
jgi:DNA uptake protein ComE-like DNA-binding protein